MTAWGRFPRASGDEPIADVFLPVDGAFSPLERGFRGAASGSGAVPLRVWRLATKRVGASSIELAPTL